MNRRRRPLLWRVGAVLLATSAAAVGTASADAPAPSTPPPSSPPPRTSPPPPVPHPPARTATGAPLGTGERLVFRMTYAHLLAGRATIAVEPGTRDGLPVYHLRLDVGSEGVFAWLFR